jgi:hypothetical protein
MLRVPLLRRSQPVLNGISPSAIWALLELLGNGLLVSPKSRERMRKGNFDAASIKGMCLSRRRYSRPTNYCWMALWF